MIHHPPIKHPVCIVYEAGKQYEWQPRKDGWCYVEDGESHAKGPSTSYCLDVATMTWGPCISGKFKPAENDNPQKDPYANCRWSLGGCTSK